ncbi:MAG: hypothetical protein JRE73_10510 [Deltaproteobacteria bacterium]|nr:hypothetical protein [Deltaproteobacteria bacterium]
MKRRDATGVSEILEEDEVSAVLRDTFYGGKSGKRSRAKPKKPKQTKPDHYDVICISLYTHPLRPRPGRYRGLPARLLACRHRGAILGANF